MPNLHYAQVSLESTPYYHCNSRCVRQAFLSGTVTCSGNCFEHRRQWIEGKLLAIAQTYVL